MAKSAKPDFPYTTFTGLVLDVSEDEAGQWVVTLTGDRQKEVARGDKAFCYQVAENEKAHYEARRLAEAH